MKCLFLKSYLIRYTDTHVLGVDIARYLHVRTDTPEWIAFDDLYAWVMKQEIPARYRSRRYDYLTAFPDVQKPPTFKLYGKISAILPAAINLRDVCNYLGLDVHEQSHVVGVSCDSFVSFQQLQRWLDTTIVTVRYEKRLQFYRDPVLCNSLGVSVPPLVIDTLADEYISIAQLARYYGLVPFTQHRSICRLPYKWAKVYDIDHVKCLRQEALPFFLMHVDESLLRGAPLDKLRTARAAASDALFDVTIDTCRTKKKYNQLLSPN